MSDEKIDAIETEEVLAKGMTKGQVQHALTHLWQDEIEIVPGKPNTYKRKA